MVAAIPGSRSDSTFYVWWRLPDGLTADRILTEARVAVAPGEGFGPSGAGWARISLATPDERLTPGLERLQVLLAGLDQDPFAGVDQPRVSTPGDSGKPPAGLKVNFEPREPVRDPTLGIQVDVDRTGTPTNRLVTIGDSVTHGFMSGAIFRTDLSWPAIVAYELGIARDVPLPGLRAARRAGRDPARHRARPAGVRVALRLEARLVRDRARAQLAPGLPGRDRGLLGARRRRQAAARQGEILHNLAIYGWDLRDTLSLNATKVRARMGRPRDDVWLPKQRVQDDNDRAALYVLESARGRGTARSPRSRPRRCWASRAPTRAEAGTGSRPWS